MNEQLQIEEECDIQSKRKMRSRGFQISITTMQLLRCNWCNTVPWACSQAELFGTGCVGCAITAKVIIDQGIYNVMLFTCLWKSAWKPETAGRKKKIMFGCKQRKACYRLICHAGETYIKPLTKDLCSGTHFNSALVEMWSGSTCKAEV